MSGIKSKKKAGIAITTNHQFYTMKFHSTKLKALGYTIDTTFTESKEFGEIISLAGSQMLRSILDIRKRTVQWSALFKEDFALGCIWQNYNSEFKF